MTDKYKELSDSEKAKLNASLSEAKELLIESREIIREQIDNIKPREARSIRELLSRIREFLDGLKEYQDIDEYASLDREAANWLSICMNKLIDVANESAFIDDVPPPIRENVNENLSTEKLKERFNATVREYIEWLRIHIQEGTTADSMPNYFKENVYLDFYDTVYQKAFERIIEELVYPDKIALMPEKKDLKKGSIESIVSYINRFLIEKFTD